MKAFIKRLSEPCFFSAISELEPDPEPTPTVPTFSRTSYHFELEENREGRTNPVRLGTVRATITFVLYITINNL